MTRVVIVLSLICTIFSHLAAENADWTSSKFPQRLMSASGRKIDTAKALKGKMVAVYFSASSCGPCRTFTPQLVDFYKKVAKKENLEIILVSSDKSSKAMRSYFRKSNMPWLAVPFGDPAAAALTKSLKVSGIPRLVVFDANGKLLSNNARWDVVLLKEKAIEAWKSANYKPKTYQEYKKSSSKETKVKDDKAKKNRDKKSKEKKSKRKKSQK